MSSIEVAAAPTRRHARSGVHLRRRWRRVDRLLTAGIGSAAVAAAICLGVTAPTSSPVQPAVPAAAAPVPQDVDGVDAARGFGQPRFTDRRDGGGGRGFGRGGR